MDALGHFGSLVDRPSLADVRHPGSSGTLPSDLGEMKSKRFFTFRWNTRRKDLITGESNVVRSFGTLRVRERSQSSPITHAALSMSRKVPSFATIFSRRPTPSWRNKRALSVESDIMAGSAAMAVGPESPSPCLPVEVIQTHRPRRTRPFTTPVGLLGQNDGCDFRSPVADDPAFRKGMFQSLDEVLKENWQLGDPILSDSESSNTRSDGATVPMSTPPIPPIIISAPTPPHSLRSEGEMPPVAQEYAKFSQVPMAIKMIQNAARQLENDANFTQKNLFQLLAPITAFLYTLGIAVIALKKEGAVTDEPDIWKASQVAIYHFIVLGIIVLMSLRGSIWIVSKLGRSFCELELENVFTRGISVDSEGERLTEADFIVGNLIS